MEQQKHTSLGRRADGPFHKYRSQAQRFAATGLTLKNISLITGVPTFVLDFHFSPEITKGEVVASLFNKTSAAKPPANEKTTYPNTPPPPGSLVICGPNGQQITFDADGNRVRRVAPGFEHLPENIEFLRNA